MTVLRATDVRVLTLVGLAFIKLTVGAVAFAGPAAARPAYPWLSSPEKARDRVSDRFAPPAGYVRVPVRAGSFAAWLRNLPLRPPGTPVRLYNGRKKARQTAHAAVYDLDIGRRDLQQCADAIMRLRAEYLYSAGRRNAIAFDFTSGDRAAFSRWAQGWRPRVKGRRVSWVRTGRRRGGYRSFRAYLTTVFTYAGTYSLARELARVRDPRDIRIGDVFVEGGFPGHAVFVVDMAVSPKTGRKAMLLAQSYTPAQDFHLLRNPRSTHGAWYEAEIGAALRTPEWTFRRRHLRRFKDPRRP